MRHPPDPPDIETAVAELLPDIIEWMRRRGHQYADCNDLAIKVAQEAKDTAASYDPSKGPIKSWVYGIAVNVSRNHWKALTRYQGTFLPDLGDIDREPAPEPSPEDQTAANEVLRYALGLLRARMNPRFYDVFVAHIDGLKDGEIAQALGIGEHTVKSRLNRARTQAREILEGHEHELRTVLPLLFGASELRFEGQAASTPPPRPAAPSPDPRPTSRRRLMYMLLLPPALGVPWATYQIGRMHSPVLLSAISSPPTIEVRVGSGSGAAVASAQPDPTPTEPIWRWAPPVPASKPRAFLLEIERALAGQQDDAARATLQRYLATYPDDPLHVKARYGWLLRK